MGSTSSSTSTCECSPYRYHHLLERLAPCPGIVAWPPSELATLSVLNRAAFILSAAFGTAASLTHLAQLAPSEEFRQGRATTRCTCSF